jgi:hypothetical protein
MVGFVAPYTFTQFGTTDNTAPSLFYKLSSSSFHTQEDSQSSLVVSCQGFITVSLTLELTYGVFFSQRNSLLAIILQLPIPKTPLSSIPLLPSSYPGRLASRNSTLHFRLLFSARLPLLFNPALCCRTLPCNHFAQTPRKTWSLF